MIASVAPVVAQLRSAEPLTRLDGARALRDLVQVHGLDALPALIASIDAAALKFPDAVEAPTGETLRAYTFYGALHEGWRAVATGDAEAARTWYAALLDRAEEADPATGARLIDALSRDPWSSTNGDGSSYGPLLAAHATRVLGLLRRWAGSEHDDRVSELVTVIQQQATRQDPIIAELAKLAPILVPAADLEDWIDIVLDRHPEPLAGLAALLGAVPAVADVDYAPQPRALLRTGRGVDLPSLATLLRPHAERWTDGELDTFVRQALLVDDADEEDEDGNPVPSLVVALRRTPTTRAVPQMLLDLGRSTPAIADLAAALGAASEPPATAPVQAGVVFTDLNFKLVVIDQLMYKQSVLTPKFDLNTFLRTFDAYEIDHPNGPYPEVLEYFERLPLTPEQLAHVTELDVDPSARIWSQIDDGWGGEEDYFDPDTYVDVAHLPNLRKVNIDFMLTEDTDLSALYERDDIEVTINE